MTNPRDTGGAAAEDPEVDAEVIADLDDVASDVTDGVVGGAACRAGGHTSSN